MERAKINDNIFKAYDVRGVYPSQIDGAAGYAIGEAFGRFIGKGKRIAVGMDVRLSSAELTENLLAGLLKAGSDVFYLGAVPHPVLYFAIIKYGLDGGVMVTASHNPPEWNGFKFYGEKARSISVGTGLEWIKDTVMEDAPAREKGPAIKLNEHVGVQDDYEKDLLGKVGRIEGLKVGIDPGNGSYSIIANKFLSKAGAEVMAINDKPDGRFPARNPEPKEEEITELREMVVKNGLDLGVAFDADGDRVVFVDDKGGVLRGDMVLALLVKNFLKPGEKAVYDISCSSIVEDEIRGRRGVPIMTKVGRTSILDRMVAEDARIGGERADHIFLSEVHSADDGLFVALKMAELLSHRKKSLSELVNEMPHYETVTKELNIEDKLKFRVVEELRERLSSKNSKVITLDGIKVIRSDGWFILRASNTTPIIRLVAESKSKEGLDRLVEYATREFEEVYAGMKK